MLMQDQNTDRKSRLLAWLKGQGVSFREIAERYGCHWTYPGKLLNSENSEMPKRFRNFMLDDLGCPEELLPPPGDKKQKTSRNQARYAQQKENQRNRAIESIRAEREGRKPQDVSIARAGI